MPESKPDPAYAAAELVVEAEGLELVSNTNLGEIKKVLNANKDRPLRRSLTMREELKSLGVVPSYMILEVMQKAMEAFESHRGMSEKGDPGTAYLAIAMKGAETLARYNYASMKAVQVTVEEAKKHFDSSDPKQILQAVLMDPFFTEEQREDLMKQLGTMAEVKERENKKPVEQELPLGIQPVTKENP